MKFISNYKHLCLLTNFQAFASSATAKCLEQDKNHLWKQGSPNNLLTEPTLSQHYFKEKKKGIQKRTIKNHPLAPDKTESFCAAFKGQ